MKISLKGPLTLDSLFQRRRVFISRVSVYTASLLLCLLSVGLIESVTASSLPFPPKPAGLTNCPTICQPEIELNSSLANKLGGPDTAKLLEPKIALLIYQSDRFKSTHNKHAQCRCVVRLTELEIKPEAEKTKFDCGKAGQGILNLFNKGNNKGRNSDIASLITDLSTNVNWSSDKLQLRVHCMVSVEILDSETEIVLAQAEGEETRTNTAKAMGVELLGLAYGKEGTANPDSGTTATSPITPIDYQTRIVQLADYHAICNLIPTLDPKLLEFTTFPPSRNEISQDSHASLFCPSCGKPVNSGDNFCTHCAGKLRKND
jgi:hypothetical protein